MKRDTASDGAVSESGQEALEEWKAQSQLSNMPGSHIKSSSDKMDHRKHWQMPARTTEPSLYTTVFSLAYRCEQHHIIDNSPGQARKYCPNFSRVTEVYRLCALSKSYM